MCGELGFAETLRGGVECYPYRRNTKNLPRVPGLARSAANDNADTLE